jgi:hypothetical protein
MLCSIRSNVSFIPILKIQYWWDHLTENSYLHSMKIWSWESSRWQRQMFIALTVRKAPYWLSQSINFAFWSTLITVHHQLQFLHKLFNSISNTITDFNWPFKQIPQESLLWETISTHKQSMSKYPKFGTHPVRGLKRILKENFFVIHTLNRGFNINITTISI